MRAPFVGAARRFSCPRPKISGLPVATVVKPDQPYTALTAISLFTNYQLGFGCRSCITAREIKLPRENT